ncbi:hypothetical protein EV1_031848 [Malus domestica]
MNLPSQVEDGNTSLVLRQSELRGREDIALIGVHPVCHGGLKEVNVFNRVLLSSIELQAKLLLCLCLEEGVEDPSCKRARPRLVPIRYLNLSFGLQLVYFLKEL